MTRKILTVNLKDSTLASDQLTVSEDARSVMVGITHGMKRTVAVIDLNDGHARRRHSSSWAVPAPQKPQSKYDHLA